MAVRTAGIDRNEEITSLHKRSDNMQLTKKTSRQHSTAAVIATAVISEQKEKWTQQTFS